MCPNVLSWSALIILQLAAFWPIGRWYWLRMSDGPDSRWGILALIAAIAFIIKDRPGFTRVQSLGIPTSMMVIYSLSYHFIPPILRAALAIVALALIVSANSSCRLLHPSLLGLFFLALPVIPTLQFFLGYPMRLMAGKIAVLLLQGGGFQVNLQGVTLNWGGILVYIDGPCSGVKMLWVGFFLTSVLTLFHDLSMRKSFAALVICPMVVIGANGLRAASLFLIEAEIYSFPSWFHEGVGIVVFTFTAATLSGLISLLARCSLGRILDKISTTILFGWRSRCVF